MRRTELKLVTTSDEEVARVVPPSEHPSGQGPCVNAAALSLVTSDDGPIPPDDAA